MVGGWALGAATFVAGMLVRDVWASGRSYVFAWKLNRELRQSEQRMIGCAHEETKIVNLAGPLHPYLARKCIRCWAIEVDVVAGPTRLGPAGEGEPPRMAKHWNANVTPPSRHPEWPGNER
jgi:hypothetical protein